MLSVTKPRNQKHAEEHAKYTRNIMRAYLFLLLLTLLFMGCQKGRVDQKYTICHTDPKTGQQETLEIDLSSLQYHYDHGDVEGECPHVNSLSYYWGDIQINAEIFSIERSSINGKLLSIRAIEVVDGATPTPIALILKIDGYKSKTGTFLFGTPEGWGGNSTTTANFQVPAWFYPPSREGVFEIKEVKKKKNGEVITGTFTIILGGQGFQDWPLTDGKFSLFIPK